MRSLPVRLTTGLVAAGLLVVGCGTTRDDDSADTAAETGPIQDLQIMVPNLPGSGYDTTARTVAKVMEDADLAQAIEVFNLEGAGGTVVPGERYGGGVRVRRGRGGERARPGGRRGWARVGFAG